MRFKLPKIKKKIVSVYLDQEMLKLLIGEAVERHRKLGPTILAVLREHFERKAAGKNVNPNAA